MNREETYMVVLHGVTSVLYISYGMTNQFIDIRRNIHDDIW